MSDKTKSYYPGDVYGNKVVIVNKQEGNINLGEHGSNFWSTLQIKEICDFDSFDELDGKPITNSNIWFIGEDGIWIGCINKGVYRLINNEVSRAVKYIRIGLKSTPNSFELPVSVEVNANFSQKSTHFSGSGLLYRYNESKKSYYALTISYGNKVVFYKKNTKGYETLYSEYSNKILHERFNKLAIIGENNLFDLYVNDSLVKSLEDDELKTGDAGIISMSTGEFFFDNFTIYEKANCIRNTVYSPLHQIAKEGCVERDTEESLEN